MLEFIVGGHSFGKCHDAMMHLVGRMLEMRKVQGSKAYEVFAHNEWMRLADDFLALAEMCERQPTEYFEHYPRLGREYASRIIEQAQFDTDENVLKAYIESYVNNFDLMEYLHRGEQ